MAVIYQITNMENGKYYIGSAESFARREWQHKYDLKRGAHKNPHLQAAWDKYGADAFVFEIIEDIAPDRASFDVENTYLMKCVGHADCYNINANAHKPRLGQTHSELTKAKIRANRVAPTGKNHYRYGQTVSEEVRARIGNTQRGKKKASGRVISEAGMAKIRAAAAAGHYASFKGKTHTEETKEKMSRQILAVLPDRTERTFTGLSILRDTMGVSIATIIRACTLGKPINRGICGGWVLSYADGARNAAPEIPEAFLGMPRTRAEAKASGALYYFTGLQCEHGHVALRKTKGVCVECAKVEGQKSNAARALKSTNSTEAWTDPETREKRQTGIKRTRSTAASKAKTSAQASAQWNDPVYAAKQTANNQEIANRPEVKAAKAAAAKAMWADPVWKAKMLAARKKVAHTTPT